MPSPSAPSSPPRRSGRSNELIGYTLGLSPSTVAGHLRRAERKLGLSSRCELIRMFARTRPLAVPRAGSPPATGSQEHRTSW